MTIRLKLYVTQEEYDQIEDAIENPPPPANGGTEIPPPEADPMTNHIRKKLGLKTLAERDKEQAEKWTRDQAERDRERRERAGLAPKRGVTPAATPTPAVALKK